MKHLRLSLLLTVFMSMVGVNAFAYDFSAKNDDGKRIYYLKKSDTEVFVTFQAASSRDASNSYYDDVVIPESVTYEGTTYNVTGIGDYAFSQCEFLTSVTIPNSITSIGGYAFSASSKLTSITIPNSVVYIGWYAFCGCSSLETVIIGNGVTDISQSMFESCYDITSITIGNSVTTIGFNAFYYCRSLTSVTLPDGVTSIGDSAFGYCSGLTSFTIPKSVTSIGGNIFSHCTGIKSVTVEREKPLKFTNTVIFGVESQATLYVPYGSKTAYESAAWWRNFKEIVEITPFRCATPTITYEDGQVTFDCETEGVEYVPMVTAPRSTKGNGLDFSTSLMVSVYATKEGYIDSEVATKEINIHSIKGDVDGDGVVDVNDVQTTINIILKK